MTTDSVGACGTFAEGASREAVNERDHSVPDEDKASWSPAGNCRLALMPAGNEGFVSRGIVSEGAASDGAFSSRLRRRTLRRVVEDVLVVADAELVPRHVHAAPEEAVVGVERDQPGALGGREDGRRLGVAPLLERLLDRPPVERRKPGPDVLFDAHAIIGSRETPSGGGASRRDLRALIPRPRRARQCAARVLPGLYGAGDHSGWTPAAPRVTDARADAPRVGLGPGPALRAGLGRAPASRPSAGALCSSDRRRRFPAGRPDQVARVASPSARHRLRVPQRPRPGRRRLLRRRRLRALDARRPSRPPLARHPPRVPARARRRLEPPLLEGALAERRRGRPRRRPGLLAGDPRRDRATAPVAAYLTDRRTPARLLVTTSGTRPGTA